MGALSRMVAGGIKGGSDVYLDISKEERAEAGEIRKEGRVGEAQLATEGRAQTIWEKKQARLAEIRGEETTAANLFATSERKAGETDKRQNTKVNYGDAIVDLDKTDPETGQATVKYQAGDKPGAGSGPGTAAFAKAKESASKRFSDEALKYYGKLDKSNILTNFGSDQLAAIAARASAISMNVWLKYEGTINKNQIWAKVFQHISDQKAYENPEAIQESIDAKEKEWWISDADKLEIKDLQTEKDEATRVINRDMSEPDMGTQGMLGRSVDRPGDQTVDSEPGQLDETPVGQEIHPPPGSLDGLNEGKLYNIKWGQYKGRKFRLENGRAILVR